MPSFAELPPEIQRELWYLVPALAYFFTGFLLFGVGLKAMNRFSPIPLTEAIEDTQNPALGILMGSILLALMVLVDGALR